MRTRKKNRYRSGYEKTVCGELDNLNIDFEYETRNLYYEVSEQRKYTPDVILPNGIILELKGRFSASDRKKNVASYQTTPGFRYSYGLSKTH